MAKAMVIFSHVKIACYFHVQRYHVQLCKCNYYYTLGSSLRKPPTFGDATAGFPTKWRLRNKHTNSIMKMHLYLVLGSGTSSVWNFCTRFSDIIWRGNLSGKVANCQLFSQATVEAMHGKGTSGYRCKIFSVSHFVDSLLCPFKLDSWL